MKPVILINGGLAYDRQFHSESFTLNKTYTAAISAAGGLPLMPLDWDALKDYAAIADGLVLSGSQGFSPDPSLLRGNEHPVRDQMDQKLIAAFVAAKKPILGICLGLQQLNVFFGGDLHPNFKLEYGVEHSMTKHTVTASEGSQLHRLFGKEFYVNSRHNVKIRHLAPGLEVTALSPDGVIEGICHPTLPIAAFQWHPERIRGDFPEPPEGPAMDPLFREFVSLCLAEKEKREG